MNIIKIKDQIKKMIETDYCFENSCLDIRNSNKKILINDFEIPFSELQFQDELSTIDFEKNLTFYKRSIPKKIIRNLKKIDISKILISKVEFYYNFGYYYNSYAEFLYSESQLTDCLEDPIKKFNFASYDVEIGEASDDFKLLFSGMTTDKYFIGWEDLNTIKIKNVTDKNFEKVIQMALFFINRYSPSQEATICKMFSHDDIPTPEESKPLKKISKIIHEEPLIFYEKALTLKGSEIAYIYFYKVLEYFFLINRREEFIKLINDYNNSNIANKIDTFIVNISKLPKNQEKENLVKLITTLQNQNKLSSILTKINSLNLSKNKFTAKVLSEKIYFLRNSIVHGKYEYGLDLRLPSIIKSSEIESWNEIIKQLAEVVIDNFCFEY